MPDPVPDIVDHLHAVIHPEFLVRAQGGMIVVEEHNPSSTNRRFEINASCRCVAIKVDFPRPAGRNQSDKTLPFFRCDVPGLTTKCDLMLFIAPGGKAARSRAFLIEMKSLNPGNSMTQMLSSRELARYLFAVARLHGVPVNDDVEYLGLRILRRAMPPKIPPKGTSRSPKPKLETHRPTGFRFCDWDAALPLTVRALREVS